MVYISFLNKLHTKHIIMDFLRKPKLVVFLQAITPSCSTSCARKTPKECHTLRNTRDTFHSRKHRLQSSPTARQFNFFRAPRPSASHVLYHVAVQRPSLTPFAGRLALLPLLCTASTTAMSTAFHCSRIIHSLPSPCPVW